MEGIAESDAIEMGMRREKDGRVGIVRCSGGSVSVESGRDDAFAARVRGNAANVDAAVGRRGIVAMV